MLVITGEWREYRNERITDTSCTQELYTGPKHSGTIHEASFCLYFFYLFNSSSLKATSLPTTKKLKRLPCCMCTCIHLYVRESTHFNFLISSLIFTKLGMNHASRYHPKALTINKSNAGDAPSYEVGAICTAIYLMVIYNTFWKHSQYFCSVQQQHNGYAKSLSVWWQYLVNNWCWACDS